MAELVDAADSKSVFERSGSSILPRGTSSIRKALIIKAFFFVWRKVGVMSEHFARTDTNLLRVDWKWVIALGASLLGFPFSYYLPAARACS